ncbi:GNAT family N-acetyltransferase [Microbacterium suwonense]|uniref:UPF0256 protein n=1 Tax=Microbacterium suwonense TaxID=683047 RepID=A0ABN6X3Y1_9MICO|nr:GNAT family N-acetyltransferase [Microbacterium suwonense]BDZ38718.1 UPF0256 protein [Microbacterium suwonense]
MSESHRTVHPVDPTSQQRLQKVGLEYRLIDTTSDADLDGFQRADARGFHDQEPTGEALAQSRETTRERRNLGVFDATAGRLPIATVNSWVTSLTVPGGELDMWAISSVTVASTHRRRGIARALLEGELRAASAAGVPMVGLTVSEATIYGRYGFSSAVPVARMTIDTARAGWAAAPVAGRLLYTDREELADQLARLHDVSRGARAGQIPGWRGRWLRLAGLGVDDKDGAAVRGIRYLDADGTVQGVMAYTLSEIPGQFRFELRIRTIVTATDEALRAIWQFVISHDLVTRATVDLRPVDDPLPWLVADQRAVGVEVHDHGWLRILDVVASLTARTYQRPLDVVLAVDDPLGFASGRWRMRVGADGRAQVESTDDAADVTLGVAELSAIFAGGVRASSLAAAGRVQAESHVIDALTAAFAADRAPVLSIWY